MLKVHHFLPGTSNVHINLIQAWCDKVAKESGDKLKCQIYPAMQLGGTPAQLFDQAKDGVADIVWTIPTYSAGRFVKSEVFELPFFTRSAKGSSQAYWAFVQKSALDEYQGVRPIFLHTNDGSSFHLTNPKGVRTLEELKGLKIRAATRLNSRMLAALGATPVQMPLPAVPEAMAKGVIDGAMVPWEGVPAAKLQEIAKSHLDAPAGQPKFANSIFAFVMNQARYDSLPPELKKVIDANSGAGRVGLGRREGLRRGGGRQPQAGQRPRQRCCSRSPTPSTSAGSRPRARSTTSGSRRSAPRAPTARPCSRRHAR